MENEIIKIEIQRLLKQTRNEESYVSIDDLVGILGNIFDDLELEEIVNKINNIRII